MSRSWLASHTRFSITAAYLAVRTDALILSPPPLSQRFSLLDRHLEPAGFAKTGGLKDVELFLEAAGDVHVPLPFASVVRDKLLTAIASGMGDHDWSGIYEITRRQAGLG